MLFRSYCAFAGRFDPSKLSLRERSIAKLGGATEGDYRDWDEVRQWADAIATSLYDDTPSFKAASAVACLK